MLAQDGSSMDARWLQIQMEELEDRWELIGRLSVSQQNRLEVALRQACGQARAAVGEGQLCGRQKLPGRAWAGTYRMGRRRARFPTYHHLPEAGQISECQEDPHSAPQNGSPFDAGVPFSCRQRSSTACCVPS